MGIEGGVMAKDSLRPDLQDQLPVLQLMLASSCFGREVCLTPPCACAQSLIDVVRKMIEAKTDPDEKERAR